MRAVLLRSLFVIGAGGLVLAGLLYVASTVDARAPEVVEIALTQPLADDPDVALITSSVEITFSEPVVADAAAAAIRLEPAVEGTVSASGSTLIFSPGEPLALDTEYTLTIGPGIRDLAGNEMRNVPEPYEFSTSGRPTLASSNPSDGAEDVPVDAAITLVFSGLMDTTSVEQALDVEPSFEHEVRWSGERLQVVPSEPLEPGREYTVTVGEAATDVAGVSLGAPVRIGFRTVEAGLSVAQLLPADGAGGISPRTQIAVAFDRPLDPESVTTDVMSVTPEVPGTVAAGEMPNEAGPTLVVFTPSAPLPPNTTFDVAVAPGVATPDGQRLAEPVSWRFTTGAPQRTLSNQVLFLSDRSGIANVWAMNPDGTGQRQVSAELVPVLEYAVAPDGSSLVVGDGRRLVYLRADGSERRVLTDPAHLEFDPTYAPDASRVVFARADGTDGTLLGLWEWEVAEGSAAAVELPEPGGTPELGASPDADEGRPARAPRFSFDGEALAWVDASGAVGILEAADEELVLAEVDASGAPMWVPDGTAVLVPTGDGPLPSTVEAPVGPLVPAEPASVVEVSREDGSALDAGFPEPVRRLVVGPDGRVAWIGEDGIARVASDPGAGSVPPALDGVAVSGLAFGPGDDVLLVVVGSDAAGRRIERVDLESGERTVLARDGWEVRWLP